jgi:hypothetical protein
MRGNLQMAWVPCAGLVHRLLAPLQVIQQRTVGVGEFPAKVMTRLEQACGSPAMQGAFTDAETVRSMALHGPERGRGHG